MEDVYLSRRVLELWNAEMDLMIKFREVLALISYKKASKSEIGLHRAKEARDEKAEFIPLFITGTQCWSLVLKQDEEGIEYAYLLAQGFGLDSSQRLLSLKHSEAKKILKADMNSADKAIYELKKRCLLLGSNLLAINELFDEVGMGLKK